MSTKILRVLLAACVCTVLVPASSMTVMRQEVKPVSDYAALRDRAKGGDLAVDFKQMRISYADSPENRNAKDTSEQQKQMFQALKAKDFKAAIQNADVALDNDYCDLDAHMVESIAYRELGDHQQADLHHGIFLGLVKSILDSGDGQSTKTSYVVIAVHEEYVILRILGLQPRGQSLIREHGHAFDLMETMDANSRKTVKLFFNVDIPMNRLDNMLDVKH